MLFCLTGTSLLDEGRLLAMIASLPQGDGNFYQKGAASICAALMQIDRRGR